MAIDPQIPTASDIVGPAVQKLIQLRPGALRSINSGQGVYSRLVTAWRAQAERMIARLTSLVGATRLDFATGQDLINRVASEYDTFPDVGPIPSVAGITLTRTGFPTTTSGVIKKGTRFLRQAVATASLPNAPIVLSQQIYTTDRDVFVPQGSVSIPSLTARALQTGSLGNTPTFAGAAAVTVTAVDPLFDAAITANGFSSAGGHTGTSDPTLRRFAKAYYQGQYAPNDAALIAGAYALGMRHFRLYDFGTGFTYLYIADDSWAYSDAWGSRVQQGLYDGGYVGFGCAVRVLGVTNVLANVDVSVTLNSANEAFDTTQIDSDIQAALLAYFDDRPDWNTWTTNGLKSVICRANRKIRSCESVVVRDSVANTVVPEPSLAFAHYYLSDNAVSINYQVP